MRLGYDSSDVSSVRMLNTTMNEVPPPCYDGSASDASEEEQRNTWNHMLKLFTLQGRNPKIQQCLEERRTNAGRH